MLELKQGRSSTDFARELFIIDGLRGPALEAMCLQMMDTSYRIVQERYMRGWGEEHPDPRVTLMASCFCKSFGDCVLWAFWLKRFQTWSSFCDFIQEGIPTEAEMKEAWESQKCKLTDNKLDSQNWKELGR